MKKATIFLLLTIFVTICCSTVNLLSFQNNPFEQQRNINAELTEFNNKWQRPESHEGDNGICNVLRLLNLDYPGLESVKESSKQKNWKEAEKQLLIYFKDTRGSKFIPQTKLSKQDSECADKALQHMFRGNKTYPPTFRGVNIDWHNKAVLNGETIYDAEWLFQYHRLTWWSSLAQAYDVTKDERYFKEWQYELIDYMDNNLPITKKTPWYIRRGMETYDRCSRHISVLPSFIRSEYFDSKTLLYFLSSFHQQAEHIRTVYAHEGNHLVGELHAVFKNGIAFPEFKKSSEWIDEALERFPQLMFSELFEDGMNRELVFSYHGMYIGLFSDFYSLVKKHGYEDRLTDEYINRLRKACDIMVYQKFPDWTNSQFGDAWKGEKGNNWVFRKHCTKLFPDVPYFTFMETLGSEGTHPPKTSISYPISGFFFFRSDWTKDAVFMSMKNGQEAEFHNQIDNGTFELYAYGRNFMNDSGCYVYNSSREEDKQWRNWFRSTKAHQTLTLNMEDAQRIPRFLFWNETDDLTALSFENQSYDNLLHRRTIFFIKNRYFLIHDQAIGSAKGDVRVHFQLVPCDFTFDPKRYEVKTSFKDGPNLIVKGFVQHGKVTMVKEEGWISYKLKQKENRPAWSYEIKKTQSQDQISFLTVLVPHKQGQMPNVLHAKFSEKNNDVQYALDLDGVKYIIDLDWNDKTTTLSKR